MRQLVVGFKGQVGSAIYAVLQGLKNQYVVGLDTETPRPVGKFGAMHVCIPYRTAVSFKAIVIAYAEEFLLPGSLLVIHSTVAIGTTTKLAARLKTISVVHSPVRGVHPNLAAGLRTFPKYFGGPAAERGAKIFKPICGQTIATPKAETTEAMKLWDTTYYGWCIVFEKAVKAYCAHHGLDFNVVYTLANESYNAGYKKLGMTNVQRPVLQHVDGPIGGHCVMPNARLLAEGDCLQGVANYLLDFQE